jgi:uncharacterized GH25 family protein
MVSETPEAEQQLRDGTHVFRMGRTLSLSGTVVDPDDSPVPNATVFLGGPGSPSKPNALTLGDGTFNLSGARPGKNLITAEATGFTAATIEVQVKDAMAPVRVQLQHGKTLRIRLLDKAGLPIADANVWYDTMRDQQRVAPGIGSAPPAVQIEFSPKTDAEGRAVWQGAPAGDLYFSFAKSGYMRLDDVKLQADADEHIITLSPSLVVSGTVVDAATGQGIPKFRIGLAWPQPGPDGKTQPRFSNIDRFWPSFANGEFRHSLEEPLIMGLPANPGYMLRFEAEGYAPNLSRVINADEGQVRLEVKLSQASDVDVKVLRPNGQPASNADVGLIASGTNLRLKPGGLSGRNEQMVGGLVHTDAAGVFKLPSSPEPDQIVVATDAGFAQAKPADLRTQPTLQLQPWGRIEGTFAAGSRAAGRLLNLISAGPGTVQLDPTAFRQTTDASGHFSFGQVPPGEWELVRLFEEKHETVTSSMQAVLQKIIVGAGETRQVTFGQNAHSIQGRIALAAGLPKDSETRIYAMVHTPIPKPPAAAQNDPAAMERWMQTPEIQAIAAKAVAYPLMQDATGSWTADEVMPGDYVVTINVIGRTNQSEPAHVLGSTELSVAVPADAAVGAIDWGELTIQPKL